MVVNLLLYVVIILAPVKFLELLSMFQTSLHFIIGLRRKADELRRNAKKDTEDSDKAEEMRTEANKLMKEASDIVEGPDLTTYVVRKSL